MWACARSGVCIAHVHAVGCAPVGSSPKLGRSRAGRPSLQPPTFRIPRSGAPRARHRGPPPPQESEFFRQFDLDGDGRINFDEYLLFTTLLAIPGEDIEGGRGGRWLLAALLPQSARLAALGSYTSLGLLLLTARFALLTWDGRRGTGRGLPPCRPAGPTRSCPPAARSGLQNPG